MEEFNLLENLLSNIDSRFLTLPDGPGDDCAIVKTVGDVLLSHDVLVNNVHFNLSWSSPEDVAWKALASNESDIASMGGVPIGYSISLVVPKGYSDFLKEFYKGINSYLIEAETRGFPQKLLGGDLSSGKELSISVAVIGKIESQPIKRTGALPGNILVMSSQIGLAGIGLQLLRDEAYRTELPKTYQDVTKLKHMRPSARTELGLYLSSHNLASSMIDISDGLFQDALHLAKASEISLRLDLNDVHYPDSPSPSEVLKRLSAGDDYELLFTLSNNKAYLDLKNVYPDIVKVGEVCILEQDYILIKDAESYLPLNSYLARELGEMTLGYQHDF